MKYTAKGTFEIYVSFEKNLQISLQNNEGAEMTFLSSVENNSKQAFELCFEADQTNFHEKADEHLKVFTLKMQFIFGAPIINCSLKEIKPELGDVITSIASHSVDTVVAKHFSASVRSMEVTGERQIRNSEVTLLEKIALQSVSSEDKFLLKLYGKSLTADLYSSFWYIYLILNIAIGGRKKIDAEIKSSFSNLPKLISDYNKEEVTIFIAIRDSFSHKSTYGGQKLDIENELKKHMVVFRVIAYKAIKDKVFSQI